MVALPYRFGSGTIYDELFPVQLDADLQVLANIVGPGGPVTGPVSSTNNAAARWNGTAGNVLKNSGVIIDDNNIISAAGLQVTRTVTAFPPDIGGGQNPVNYFSMTDNNVDAGGSFILGEENRYLFNGTSTKGGRIASYDFLANGSITSASNTNRNYAASSSVVYTAFGDGGTNTSTGAKGAFFGANPVAFLDAGAVNVFDAAGMEINLFVNLGASARLQRALSIMCVNKVRGAEVDAAFTISAGVGHIGYNHGILFTDVNSANPFYSGSTLIGSYWAITPPTVTTGIDFNGFTFTGNAFQTTGFTVNGGGRTTVNYAPVYDLGSGFLGANTMSVALFMPVANPIVVPANKFHHLIRASQSSGDNNQFTVNSGSIAMGFATYMKGTSASDAAGVVYGVVPALTNDGPATLKAVHSSVTATGTSSGTNVAGSFGLTPVPTTSIGSMGVHSAVICDDTGANDTVTAYGITSSNTAGGTGQVRLRYGVGNVIHAVPIGVSFYQAWMDSTFSATNARAFQTLTGGASDANEVMYIKRTGEVVSTTALIGGVSESNAVSITTGAVTRTSAAGNLQILSGSNAGTLIALTASGVTQAQVFSDRLELGTTLAQTGVIKFVNLTSGSISITPPSTGALGTQTLTLPDITATLTGGPTTTTDNAIVRWDGTVGGSIQNTAGVTISDAFAMTINANTASLPAPPTGSLLRIGGPDGSPSTLTLDSFANTTVMEVRRANTSAAAPSAVSLNNNLFVLQLDGYGSTGYSSGGVGWLYWYATQNFTDTAHGTQAVMGTCTNGSASATDRFVIDNTGFVMIGDSHYSPTARLTVSDNATDPLPSQLGNTQLQLAAADSLPTRLLMDVYGTNSVIAFRRANGTAAAPTKLLAGDIINVTLATGTYDGGGGVGTFANAIRAAIEFRALEDWISSAVNGTMIDVLTTPSGTNTPTFMARFHGSGGFSVGTTTDPGINNIQANSTVIAAAFKNATYMGGSAIGVNLNSAATDTAITITLPVGITKYRILHVIVSNRGTTASLTTATAGLFSSSGGGGIAICPDQALSAATSNADDTLANMVQMAATNTIGLRLTDTSLFFRVGTAQGASATADVFIYIQPLV